MMIHLAEKSERTTCLYSCIVGRRKNLIVKSKRNPVFVSNLLINATMSVIILSFIVNIWEILSIFKSAPLTNNQSRQGDTASYDSTVPSVGAMTSTTNENHSLNQQNQILYTGSFGLGHRMNKLSCVYHLLAAKINRSDLYKYISLIKVEWGTCPISNTTDGQVNTDIFAYLFGSQYINPIEVLHHNDRYDDKRIPKSNELQNENFYGNKTLWIRNDVAGYFAGQSYKNAKIKLKDSNTGEKFVDKLLSDYDLFRYLIKSRFVGYGHIRQYKQKHKWEQHFVMGIHIRAGNGEQNHFVQSGRSIVMNDNADEKNTRRNDRIVQHIARSILQIYNNVKRDGQSISVKPPLVFVATDTEHFIKAIAKALQRYNIPLIHFNEQPRIPRGMGVSYDNKIFLQQTNISCYQSWHGSMIDMILLSESDTVVATSRSTFTQIIPSSMVFHRSGRSTTTDRYCEMDILSTGSKTKVTCFQNQTSWLLRNNSSEWNTFCVTGDDSSSGDTACNNTTSGNKDTSPVTHKLLVHFPDVDVHDRKHRNMYTNAIEFLQQSAPLPLNERLFYYGKKYNSKYRVRSDTKETIQINWTWK